MPSAGFRICDLVGPPFKWGRREAPLPSFTLRASPGKGEGTWEGPKGVSARGSVRSAVRRGRFHGRSLCGVDPVHRGLGQRKETDGEKTEKAQVGEELVRRRDLGPESARLPRARAALVNTRRRVADTPT